MSGSVTVRYELETDFNERTDHGLYLAGPTFLVLRPGDLVTLTDHDTLLCDGIVREFTNRVALVEPDETTYRPAESPR